MECKSSTSSAPACEVVFTSLPVGSRPLITIEVANTDFDGSDEYVSRVVVGGQTIGTNYLTSGGLQERCDVMSKIVDAQAAPAGTVSAAGELVVRIELSYSVGCRSCNDASCMYSQVSISCAAGTDI